MNTYRSPCRSAWVGGALTVLCSLPFWNVAAAAGSDEQAWREECSSCHIAYPARFLSADSWKEIMATLDNHFGADATVDAQTAEKISRYLASAARSPSRSQANASSLRITESRWFLHEHDEISATVWRNPKVKSPANCGACHQGADGGRFSEKAIQIPK